MQKPPTSIAWMMLAKLLAAALSSCCVAIPVTFKVQVLFEQRRLCVLRRSDIGMSRTLDFRYQAACSSSLLRDFVPSLAVRRLIFEGDRWHLEVRILSEPFRAGTSQMPLPPVSTLCVGCGIFWERGQVEFSQCTKALTDGDVDGIYAALLRSNAGTFRMRDS